MATTVSHPSPTAQAQAIADLTSYEDAALAAGLRACGQYPHGPAQWPLCQRAHGAYAPGPRTGPARRRHPARGWRAAQRRGAQWQHALSDRYAVAHLHLYGLPEALAGLQGVCSG